MKYTTQKPTKPGYYFFRYWRYNSDKPIQYVIRILEIDGKLWVNDEINEELLKEYANFHPISPVRSEYAGPIPEPDE